MSNFFKFLRNGKKKHQPVQPLNITQLNKKLKRIRRIEISLLVGTNLFPIPVTIAAFIVIPKPVVILASVLSVMCLLSYFYVRSKRQGVEDKIEPPKGLSHEHFGADLKGAKVVTYTFHRVKEKEAQKSADVKAKKKKSKHKSRAS